GTLTMPQERTPQPTAPHAPQSQQWLPCVLDGSDKPQWLPRRRNQSAGMSRETPDNHSRYATADWSVDTLAPTCARQRNRSKTKTWSTDGRYPRICTLPNTARPENVVEQSSGFPD